MGLSFFSPEVQQAAANEIKARERLRQSALQGATPELAQTVSNIYQRANFLRPSQVLPLAKANASPQTVDFANEQAAKLTTQDVPEEPESWWKRNIYGNLKKASRYTFAALSIFPESVQNIAANIANDAPGDDFWKSTSIGTMLEDSEKAGSGFFMGGEAAELQAERARKYRGTIDEERKRAFTVGRASAKLIFDEDSTAYSILSGLIDASINIFCRPNTCIWWQDQGTARSKVRDPRHRRRPCPLRKGSRGRRWRPVKGKPGVGWLQVHVVVEHQQSRTAR